MPTDAPPWIKLSIAAAAGGRVALTSQGSRGGGGGHTLTSSLDELEDFTRAVGERATARAPLDGKTVPLDDETVKKARELFQDVFQGKTLEAAADHVGHVGREPLSRLLVRLAVSGPRLQAIAWESMHTPRAGSLDTNGSLAGAPRLQVIREVADRGPARALRILGPVRVLVLAAATTGVTEGIAAALADAIGTGAIEPLDVIPPEQVATLPDLRKALELRSAPGRSPHVLHIIGHGALSRPGGDAEAKPVLLLPGRLGGPVEIPVQTLADDLPRFFGDALRLVILDACEGAAPGPTGSAAELLARSAAVAVIAHLWPVDARVARALAASFYTSLTAWHQALGDVAACLTSARSELEATKGAGAFSPVLYLRGESPVLFDFRGRRKPPPEPAPHDDPPEMEKILDRILLRPFSLVLGDPADDPLDWHAALRRKIAGELSVGEDELPSVRAAIERCVLVHGRKKLEGLFKEVFELVLKEDGAPVTSLAWELARILKPGVHTTLLWLPHLEHAIAERCPDRHVYVIQPESTSLWARWREAGKDAWTLPEKGWSSELDFTRDYVILRPYGGFLPVLTVMGTLLTEEDHTLNPRSTDMPDGWDDLLNQLRGRPALVAGVSIFDWRHRMILRRLFDTRLPAKSVAVLPRDAEKLERKVWEARGGGLDEFGANDKRVDVVLHGAHSLARKVARFAS